MNIPDIIALQPGPALDSAVHLHVFAQKDSPAPLYSFNDAAAITILDRLPLYVGRVEPTSDPARPWSAGILAHDPAGKMDYTALRVLAPTKAVALCKAALLHMFRDGGRPAVAKGANHESAESAVARVGTARANNPNFKAPTRPMLDPNRPMGLKSRRIEAARLAKLAGKKGRVTVSESAAPSKINQPRVFAGANTPLPPMPERKPIVPIDNTK